MFLTQIMFMKVSMFLPDPEVCGGRLPLVELVPILAECGDSFYNVIACFFDGNGTIPKVVFSSSLRGEVSTLWFL